MSPIHNNSSNIAPYVESQDPSGALAARLYRALKLPFRLRRRTGAPEGPLILIAVLADGAGFSESTGKAVEI